MEQLGAELSILRQVEQRIQAAEREVEQWIGRLRQVVQRIRVGELVEISPWAVAAQGFGETAEQEAVGERSSGPEVGREGC
jgi:hypothetical protein